MSVLPLNLPQRSRVRTRGPLRYAARMSLRSSILLCTLTLAPPLACGPDKGTETDGDSSAGSSSTAEPTTAAPATTTTGGSTGSPGSTSTDGTTGTTSSAASSGDPPPGACETRTTKEECLATDGGEGHDECAWQPEFAQWSEQDGCGAFAGPPRCLPVQYVGDGCQVSGCPTFQRVYFRDLGGGDIELMDYQGGCGLEPDGWSQCVDPGSDPPACACFC